MCKKIAEIIATVCFIGRIKYAPGTFGSIPAFPLCYIIMYFTLNNKIIFPFIPYDPHDQQIISLFLLELLLCLVLFIVGTYFTAIYIKDKRDQDPKEVVIDEVVGQMLTIILCSFSVMLAHQTSLPLYFNSLYVDIVFLCIMPFILFRFFDIYKPWPINWLDKNIKGAFGVMIDDIVAALFATTAQYTIVFLILDFASIG